MGSAEGVGSDRVSTAPVSLRGGAGEADPRRRKGPGTERSWTARRATRQRRHQALGQARAGQERMTASPGLAPREGHPHTLRSHAQPQEKGPAQGREEGGGGQHSPAPVGKGCREVASFCTGRFPSADSAFQRALGRVTGTGRQARDLPKCPAQCRVTRLTGMS